MNWQRKFNFDKVTMKNFGGHDDEVNCVALSVDFEMMVTGSDDYRLRIFNTLSGELVATLEGHVGAIKAVSVSPNSCFIASASYDKLVGIWLTREARCLYMLSGHTKSVECVAFSSNSRLLCSGSWDKSAVLWNTEDGSKLKVLFGHQDLVQSVAFSCDGSYLATGSWDYSVQVWTIDAKDLRRQLADTVLHEFEEKEINSRICLFKRLTGHTGNIHTVAFSRALMLASGSWDKTVRLWNPRTGRCLFELRGHCGWVQAVAFSADSQHLVSAGDSDAAIIWCCTTGCCIRKLDLTDADTVSQCAFGPKGIIIASAAGTLRTAQCNWQEAT